MTNTRFVPITQCIDCAYLLDNQCTLDEIPIDMKDVFVIPDSCSLPGPTDIPYLALHIASTQMRKEIENAKVELRNTWDRLNEINLSIALAETVMLVNVSMAKDGIIEETKSKQE